MKNVKSKINCWGDSKFPSHTNIKKFKRTEEYNSEYPTGIEDNSHIKQKRNFEIDYFFDIENQFNRINKISSI